MPKNWRLRGGGAAAEGACVCVGEGLTSATAGQSVTKIVDDAIEELPGAVLTGITAGGESHELRLHYNIQLRRGFKAATPREREPIPIVNSTAIKLG